jgi:hypothetical protein
MKNNSIEKLRRYQKIYDIMFVRLQDLLQQEFNKRGGDTNTYLPKEYGKTN